MPWLFPKEYFTEIGQFSKKLWTPKMCDLYGFDIISVHDKKKDIN